ncbi:hypothetical protein MNV49_002849 [Pseudohyphozyma bogoriensis]|nr:hypothetical protein MNV49_002849 [Pseudohyphozyma bogoriensis]
MQYSRALSLSLLTLASLSLAAPVPRDKLAQRDGGLINIAPVIDPSIDIDIAPVLELVPDLLNGLTAGIAAGNPVTTTHVNDPSDTKRDLEDSISEEKRDILIEERQVDASEPAVEKRDDSASTLAAEKREVDGETEEKRQLINISPVIDPSISTTLEPAIEVVPDVLDDACLGIATCNPVTTTHINDEKREVDDEKREIDPTAASESSFLKEKTKKRRQLINLSPTISPDVDLTVAPTIEAAGSLLDDLTAGIAAGNPVSVTDINSKKEKKRQLIDLSPEISPDLSLDLSPVIDVVPDLLNDLCAGIAVCNPVTTEHVNSD